METFEAARSRMLKTWVRDRENVMGFECDLEHGLEVCRAIATWEIVQTGEADRMVAVRCRSATSDVDEATEALVASYNRHVAYEGDSAEEIEHDGRDVVFRFATRSRRTPQLVATGEIRIVFEPD